jgi:hypothetical protein
MVVVQLGDVWAVKIAIGAYDEGRVDIPTRLVLIRTREHFVIADDGLPVLQFRTLGKQGSSHHSHGVG